MTEDEAAIVSAYTGYLIGRFSEVHEYVEKILGRPVFTHEMAEGTETSKTIHEKSRADFIKIKVEG